MAKRLGVFTWPFNANIEGRISSMYKAVAKQQLRVGAEIAELLDFGQLWGSLDMRPSRIMSTAKQPSTTLRGRQTDWKTANLSNQLHLTRDSPDDTLTELVF